MIKKVIWILLGVSLCVVLFTGCSGVLKTAPIINVTANPQLDRNEYVILDRVEGESTTTSILFGLIKFIDGTKLQFLGLKFYEDEYAFQNPRISLMARVGTDERAYYKALAKAPDADLIFQRSLTYQKSGIPLLYTTEKATFTGKAIKIKTDAEL